VHQQTQRPDGTWEKEFAVKHSIKHPRTSRICTVALALFVTAALCAVAVGSAGASGTAQHWYSCVHSGTGKYSPGCLTEGAGGYELSKVKSGSSFDLKGETASKEKLPISFYWLWGGLEIEAKCTGSTGGGNLINPTEGSASVENLKLTATGCTFPKPVSQECKMRNGELPFSLLKGTTEESGRVMLGNQEPGKPLAEFTIEGCKTWGINGTKQVTGALETRFISSTSRLELVKQKTGGSTTGIGGNYVTFSGASEMLLHHEEGKSTPLILAP
jgi:hypothetical protein